MVICYFLIDLSVNEPNSSTKDQSVSIILYYFTSQFACRFTLSDFMAWYQNRVQHQHISILALIQVSSNNLKGCSGSSLVLRPE